MAKEPKTFSLKDVGVLKEGILAEEAGMKPLSSFDIDFTLRPETVFGALPLGNVSILGQAIGKFQTEDAATNLLNTLSPNQIDTDIGATLKRAGTGESATNAVIQDIKNFKDNDPFSTTENITRDDIQRYLMEKSPQLDLAPIQTPRFTRQQLAERSTDFEKAEQQYGTQPFRSGGTFRAFEDLPRTQEGGFRYNQPFVTEDEKGNLVGTGRTFAEELRRGTFDDQLKSTDQFAEDKITQTNITNYDPDKGTYDPAFARAVTLENQEQSTSEPTFICTVLFEMNILPMSIYKYSFKL